MAESRHQRRRRERADAQTSTRPGSALALVPRPTRVVDIELNRIADPEGDDASAVSWAASWGLHGDTSGIEDSSDKLAELVAAILADLQPWTSRYTLTLAWTLDGDAPRGHTVAEAVAATGVTLPTTTNPERASR